MGRQGTGNQVGVGALLLRPLGYHHDLHQLIGYFGQFKGDNVFGREVEAGFAVLNFLGDDVAGDFTRVEVNHVLIANQRQGRGSQHHGVDNGVGYKGLFQFDQTVGRHVEAGRAGLDLV